MHDMARTEFTLQELDLLDKISHRLLRICDYSSPNGMQYFGVPNENHNARASVSELSNQINYYLNEDSEERFRPRLAEYSRRRVLYFLKESDEHLVKANREAGVRVRPEQLYEKTKAWFEQLGFHQQVEKVEAPSARAKAELDRFKAYYDPHKDAMLFRANEPQTGEIVMQGPLDGAHVQLPFSLAAVEFGEERLRGMLIKPNPEMYIDFTLSKAQIVSAVAEVAPKDAEVVRRVLNRGERFTEVHWGPSVTRNPVREPFGVQWRNDWAELSMEGRAVVNKAWEEICSKVKTAQAMYPDAEALVKSLNKPQMQEKFIATTLRSVALQSEATPPGSKPRQDGAPGMV